MRRGIGEWVQRLLVDKLLGMPRPAARRLFGPPPTNDRGARLDWQLHVLLSLKELLGVPDLHAHPLEKARDIYNQSCRVFARPGCQVAEVREVEIPGPAGTVPARLYRPTEAETLPGVVFYHGGGFTIGTLDGYDSLCRHLADRGGCLVASVDYRLAPEHPFPAAVDDALAAYRWMRERAGTLGVDPDRIAVAGDSAGGNIAAVTSHRAVDRDLAPPALQLLIYPKTDEGGSYASRRHFDEGFYLPWELVEWFSDHYLAGADFDGPAADHPHISPIVYERPGQLPPTIVVTAGFDPLRDEGEAYADRLEAHGVRVMRHRRDRLVHGFVTMGGVVDAAARAMGDIAEALRRELHRR